MKLKDIYKKETNKSAQCVTRTGVYVKSGTYTDDYVKWLEKLIENK